MHHAPAVPCARESWMHGRALPIAGLALAFALLLPARAAVAGPESERPFTVSVCGGYRFHNEHLGLEDALAFGGRLATGLSPRVEIALDFTASTGKRKATQHLAGVDLLRALARWNALEGPVRPYPLVGAGMALMDFSDGPDFASYVLVLGLGVERDLPHHFVLRAEGVLDFYRADRVLYDSLGRVIRREEATTDGLGTFTISLGARF